MPRITLDLIRKRCEHNEGLVHNLEELSLHQDNLEEIENIDKWCKNLKILYLQSNSIQKIENLNRLKSLEYLNLALNGIERIENLEGCESLRKLDLTANFIGDLTSAESLRANPYLEELFLTGNPCVDYEGYRSYIIAALPHLRAVDGQEVTRTEQLTALRHFLDIKAKIIQQQVLYKANREKEKAANLVKLSHGQGDRTPGEWQDITWSPEYRREMHRHNVDNQQEQTKSRTTNFSQTTEKRPVVLRNSQGEIMNVNQARLEYVLSEEEENNQLFLDISVYRHLDTSWIDIDINPFHVKCVIKGKILQLLLPHEVMPDHSTIQRSRTSGHLLIHMPLAGDYYVRSAGKKQRSRQTPSTTATTTSDAGSSSLTASSAGKVQKLDVDPTVKSKLDLHFAKPDIGQRQRVDGAITGKRSGFGSDNDREMLTRPDSPDFVDNADVPPLV